jgi:Ca-activated chloride channel family protein
MFLGAYEGIWKQGAKKIVNTDITLPPEENELYLEVIWDASGSMWGRDYGVEKIIRSKEVLKTFASELPEEINLGLRIFGARRVGDPEDSFMAIPFNESDREKVINFITNVKPLGRSPIGYSLREAGKDLEKVSGKKFILLVSDGIENGDIPAEEIVDELKEKNIVLHVVHIGEPDNEDIKKKLKELANTTGGYYYTYSNHEEVIPTFLQ